MLGFENLFDGGKVKAIVDKTAFKDNEMAANKYAAKCLRILSIVVACVWILNLLNIFIVDQVIMAIAAAGSIVFFLLPTLLCKIIKKESPYLKYLIMGSCLLGIFLLAGAMPKHAIIAWAAPVVLACHYYSKGFAYGTLIPSIILMGGSIIIGAYFGEWDPNILGITLSESIKNEVGRVVDATVYKRIFLFLLLPRAMTLVGITVLCGTLANRTHKLLETQIQDNIEKQQIASELGIATHIQTSMLPCIFPAFPERVEFDVYASMTPAREVGGDFYDFFMVDEKHLAIVMADVSDKGVPAALFMVIGKTLIKDHTTSGRDLGEVFTTVNNLLCESNSEGLFITAFEGVLDLETGEFNFVNAGHEMPYIYRAGEGFKPEKIKAGFVLAGMENIRYKAGSLKLNVGDKIFQYTDGVTEATNANKELYGMERLGVALNNVATKSPQEILNGIKADIDEFVGEAPQFDDITMLCLEYKEKMKKQGDNSMKELNIEATVENIEKVTDFVNEQLEFLGCSMKAQTQIDIAIDELFGNIAHYAYSPEVGKATVRVEVIKDPLSVVITFIDNGVPYDPLKAADPDVTLSAEEREIGGLGIFMVKKSMDDVSYEYKEGQNILRIKKQI